MWVRQCKIRKSILNIGMPYLSRENYELSEIMIEIHYQVLRSKDIIREENSYNAVIIGND